jgi:hypothetical protein
LLDVDLKKYFTTKTYLEVWLRLFFKVFFVLKYIKIIFFLFLKIIFLNQRIKTIQNTKKLIFTKTNFEFLKNAVYTMFQTKSK